MGLFKRVNIINWLENVILPMLQMQINQLKTDYDLKIKNIEDKTPNHGTFISTNNLNNLKMYQIKYQK